MMPVSLPAVPNRRFRPVPARVLLTLAAMAAALALAAPPAPARVPASRAEIDLSFAPVARRAAPAVLNIYARRLVAQRVSPFAADPFFREFFGDIGPAVPRIQQSLGSGVIVEPDGLVVTNNHVIAGADEIRAVTSDGREFAATVLLADRELDLAVLRLEDARGLPTLELRDSDTLEVGDLVLAIGNPFGVGQTVSSGIVSGLARSGVATGSIRGYYIQTDAPINPGNSGGALVDMGGRLIGINTAILTRSGGSNGIGFAIPSNLVAAFVAQAKAGNEHFLRPWAGMTGQDIDWDLARSLGLDRAQGMLVTELHPQSPFARAGLRPGDVIVALGGRPVRSPAEMLYRLLTHQIGETVTVEFVREGRRMSARVRLALPPEEPPRDEVTIGGLSPLSGLTAWNINPAVARELDLPADAKGVVVAEARGLAAEIGLRRGDVIVAINGRAIRSTRDLRRAARDEVAVWEILIERGGRRLVLRFRV